MVKIGNFFFHYRNMLFPLFYLVLFIPSPGVFNSFPAPVFLGLSIALIGQSIRVATIGLVYIIRGGRKRRIYAENLVAEGIFSHCRNPLYLGNILELLGLGIISDSIVFLAVVFPAFVFMYQAIVRAEENFLFNKFGGQYENYLRTVNRWMPDLKGINATLESMKFNWMRVLVKEYNSTFIWTSAATLLIMRNYHRLSSARDFNRSLPYFILTIFFLSASYGIVRYLKKSQKIVGN